MLWASFYWFKHGISYTMNLGASPQLEHWSIGLPWRELSGIQCCRCNTWGAEVIKSSPCKPVLGQGVMARHGAFCMCVVCGQAPTSAPAIRYSRAFGLGQGPPWRDVIGVGCRV